MTLMPDVLTLEEVANYLRLPEETIAQEALHGHIPGRRIADTWRFLKAAIDDWLRSQDSRTILLQQVGALSNDDPLPAPPAAIYDIQKWEYLALYRWRSSTPVKDDVDKWKWTYNPVFEGLVKAPKGLATVSTGQVLTHLGDQGWELLSLTPRSGSVVGNGFAGEEVWIFKRAKS